MFNIIKFDEGSYLTVRIKGDMYVSAEVCNEWIHAPLLASSCVLKGEVLTVNIGSGVLITLKKKNYNFSKL